MGLLPDSYFSAVQSQLGGSATQPVAGEAALSAPQMAQLETQFATTEQQLGDTPAELQAQGDYSTQMAGYQLGGLGINAQQSALQQQGTEQSYGLTQQSQAQQGAQNVQNFQKQLQGLTGGEAASGSLNTAGAKANAANLGQQNQWNQATLNRQEQQSAGDFARAQQNYALIGKANGLSQDEVQLRLQNGLEQLGLGSDPSSLVSQAGNVLSGSAQGVGSVLSQAGMLQGINTLSALG
jgi:hypothetical protein